MISLRHSVAALDRLESLQKSYLATLRDLREAVIDLKPELTQQHREVVQAAESRLQAAQSAADIEAAGRLVHDELFEYQSQAKHIVDELRESVKSIAKVLEEVTTTVSGEVQTDTLNGELARLQKLLATDDLAQIRVGLRAAITTIATSVEDIKRQNRLLIAQFREEIGTLHAQLRSQQTSAPKPGIVEEANDDAAQFSLLAIWISNWKHACQSFPANLKAEAFESFQQHLGQALGYLPETTRLEEDLLMLKLAVPPQVATSISKSVMGAALPQFTYTLQGKKYSLRWRIRTGIAHAHDREDPQKLMQRFDQLTDALRRSG